MKNKTYLIIGTVAFLLGLFILAVKFYKNDEAQKTAALAKEDMSLFVKDYSPKLGREGAEVVLVEFFDPECESCREFYPFVKMLMNQYEGKIQLVLRYAPFHGNSIFIVKILEAARKQNRYWETLEVLYQHQPEWGSHHNPKPELVWNYLETIGLNTDKIKMDMEDPEIQKIINQDMLDGEKLGVRMTPTFFVNGKPLESFGHDQLDQAIKDALKK